MDNLITSMFDEGQPIVNKNYKRDLYRWAKKGGDFPRKYINRAPSKAEQQEAEILARKYHERREKIRFFLSHNKKQIIVHGVFFIIFVTSWFINLAAATHVLITLSYIPILSTLTPSARNGSTLLDNLLLTFFVLLSLTIATLFMIPTKVIPTKIYDFQRVKCGNYICIQAAGELWHDEAIKWIETDPSKIVILHRWNALHIRMEDELRVGDYNE